MNYTLIRGELRGQKVVTKRYIQSDIEKHSRVFGLKRPLGVIIIMDGGENG